LHILLLNIYLDEPDSIDRNAHHCTYPLEDFQWNAGSTLDRYSQSKWDHECASAKASQIQGNTIYLVEWNAINGDSIEFNKQLPSVKSKPGEIDLVDFNINTLFDDYSGIREFWYNIDLIPQPLSDTKTITFAIINDDIIAGLIVVEICDSREGMANNYLRNLKYYKCIIQQRSVGDVQMSIENVNIENIGFSSYISINNDNSLLIDIGSNKCNYIDELSHILEYYSFELDGKIQFDNSCKNECMGHGSANCGSPCVDCMIQSKDIYKFPTPTTMSNATRTYESMVNDASKSVKSVNTGKWGLKQSNGCKHTPIFIVREWKYGSASMHDFEGIHAVSIDTFSDMLNVSTNNDISTPIGKLKEQHSLVQSNYDDMTHHHDLYLKFKDEPMVNDELKSKSVMAKRLYELSEKELQEMLESNKNEDMLIVQFIDALNKKKINLNYCMSNNVAGGTCGLIDEARSDLYDIATEQKVVHGVFWKKYFACLAYVHDMLKSKNERPWNMHDKCTIKHAYIDLYHCLILATRLWRKEGKCGIKIHLLAHEIDRSLRNGASCAYYDDQRIENCHQHVCESNIIYNRYYRSDKLLLQVKKMNTRTLSGAEM
jgi:hypothetical protein